MDAREQWRKVRETDTPGSLTLGPNTFDRYIHDPKRIAFMLARYKFAAKMLRGKSRVIDVGCGDGFGTLTFAREGATHVYGFDFDETLIAYANDTLLPAFQSTSPTVHVGFACADIMSPGWGWKTPALCCLDVIEHVEPTQGELFVRSLAGALTDDGVAVIGTPSALAAQYASAHSNLGHINLYEPDRLRDELGAEFKHVFLFSMNDELVHTGFDKMAHYLMALCVK